MKFDINFYDNASTVSVSDATGGEWTLDKSDLNSHSAAWFINLLFVRPDSEKL